MKSQPKIKDEEYLLLELCRLEFNNEQLSRIKSLVAVISDWNYFRDLANEHGVPALVWHNLETYQLTSAIPEEVCSFLKGTLLRSLSRNAFNSEIMSTVLRLLNNENIKTVNAFLTVTSTFSIAELIYNHSLLKGPLKIVTIPKDAVK